MTRLKMTCAAALTAMGAGASNAAVVKTFDFDTAANAEGWSALSNVTGLTADGDSLNGTASTNDPQLGYTTPALSKAVGSNWTTVTFRVRETQDESPAGVVTAFDGTGLVVQINGGGNGAGGSGLTVSSFTGVASGDNFFTVTGNISGFTAASITNLRLDPIGGAASNSNSETNGNSFEVDFIEISDDSVIPEPGSLALLGLGGLLIARRRRT